MNLTISTQINAGIKQIVSSICYKLHKSHQGQRVLMYHSIGTNPKGLFGLSDNDFKLHMQWLNSHKTQFPVIPIDQVGESSDYGVAISFDDGFVDNLRIATPILRSFKFPFCVFVGSDFIGDGSNGYLSIDELRELASIPGVEIGSHGKSHRPLANLSEKDIYDELQGSKEKIEKIINKEINFMSYPHGSCNAKVFNATSRVGYKKIFSSFVGANTPSTPKTCLRRNEINNGDSVTDLERKLLGSDDWRLGIQYIRNPSKGILI